MESNEGFDYLRKSVISKNLCWDKLTDHGKVLASFIDPVACEEEVMDIIILGFKLEYIPTLLWANGGKIISSEFVMI